ncbi:MAG: TonB-dependent receptor, partial [Burkholderiales bacterium]
MKTKNKLLLPLGALAAGFGMASTAFAQTAEPPRELPTIKARAAKEPQGKDSLQATETQIGKGKQELRDIPQSLTVVTEKLIDDRNLDTLRDTLKQTAGVSFLAAEGGEEDIRLRGLPLQGTGDVFVDGLRDPAFYERDTFNYERREVLRGSASMLFGRGSTGGAVNQVNKVPRLLDQHQGDFTVGSHGYLRTVGDFNLRLGDSSTARVSAMATVADNNGAGTPLNKQGLAASWRTGIGERDEFLLSAYVLRNRNGMNYGLPWIRPSATSPMQHTTVLPLDPSTSYASASDRNNGEAQTLTLRHTHRFDAKTEWTTTLRQGAYERDQRASTIRFAAAALQPGGLPVSLQTFSANTLLNRGSPLKIQNLDTLMLQSDFNSRFEALGLQHSLQAGIDIARENKDVFAARSRAQGGVDLIKNPTRIGTPSDGFSVDEDSRVLRLANQYQSTGWGAYVQDLVRLRQDLKLLLGARYDRLRGDYNAFAIPAAAPAPETRSSYRMQVGEWSYRSGLLFQPNERMSFHLSAATSFNTSGDAYSLSPQSVDIPPEQAINMEAGAKIDSADGKWSARVAVFRATKLHERNTDPLVNAVTLSGKRHVAGFEFDLAGKLSSQWEA